MLSRAPRLAAHVLGSLGWLAAVSPLAAQEVPTPPSQAFTEQVEVNVVDVDVYVADAKGVPITDLRREDFQLFEDGKPVEVTNFFAASSHPEMPATLAPAMPATVAPRPEEQRLDLVVFVDDLNTEAHNRNRVLGQVEEFLERRLEPGDRVMLVRFQGSIDVLRPFTTDLAQVKKDLSGIEKLTTRGQELGSFRQANNEIAAAAAESFGGCSQALEQTVKAYADAENHHLDSTLRALDAMVSAVAPAPGRKALLYVGDGVSANPGFDLFQRLGSCLHATSGFVSARTYDSRARFNEVTSHASRNRVAFYTLETATNSAGVLAERDRMEMRQESLRRLAEDTGGQAMLNVADARLSLGLMARDLTDYYSLGYRPPRAGDGLDHKIEVRVQRKGATVRHRQWYRDKPQSERVAERTAAAMLYGFEDNPLAMRIEIGRQVSQGDLFVVPVRLKVPFAKLTLLARDGARVGHLRFFVVASGNGEITPVRTSEVDVRLPEARAAAALHQDYVHEVRMKLKPGDYVLGVGLRDDLAATASYLKGSVQAGTVPAATTLPPAAATSRNSTPGQEL